MSIHAKNQSSKISCYRLFKINLVPEIPYPTDEEEGGVPEGDESVLAEEDGLRPHGGLGELGEYNSRHASLKEIASYL